MSWKKPKQSNSVIPGSHPDQTYVPYCVSLSNCKGFTLLVETCYGITGGDKWKCQSCGSYVVTAPDRLPNKPTNYVIK